MNELPPNNTPFRRKKTPPGGHSTPSNPFVVIEYSPFFIAGPDS